MLISNFNHDYEYWQLYHKVTFDGANRLILINFGETAIDFETDIYSDWKEWVRVRENGKYAAALRTVGGDPLNAEGDALGATFFLINGWRIQTWDGDHTLTVFGNFVVDDLAGLYETTGGVISDPEFSDRINVDKLLPTPDSIHTVLVTNAVSNIIDKVATGGGSGGPPPTAEEIATAVWDRVLTQHPTVGTFGEKVGRQQVTLNNGDGVYIEIDD